MERLSCPIRKCKMNRVSLHRYAWNVELAGLYNPSECNQKLQDTRIMKAYLEGVGCMQPHQSV